MSQTPNLFAYMPSYEEAVALYLNQTQNQTISELAPAAPVQTPANAVPPPPNLSTTKTP